MWNWPDLFNDFYFARTNKKSNKWKIKRIVRSKVRITISLCLSTRNGYPLYVLYEGYASLVQMDNNFLYPRSVILFSWSNCICPFHYFSVGFLHFHFIFDCELVIVMAKQTWWKYSKDTIVMGWFQLWPKQWVVAYWIFHDLVLSFAIYRVFNIFNWSFGPFSSAIEWPLMWTRSLLKSMICKFCELRFFISQEKVPLYFLWYRKQHKIITKKTLKKWKWWEILLCFSRICRFQYYFPLFYSFAE